MLGDGQSLKYGDINDRLLGTGIVVSDANPEYQSIVANWGGVAYDVGAVWLVTDEALMTSGTVKFYVDEVECPDTNGVGVNALGGVFNCNLKGEELKIVCTSTCSPNFAIKELKIWNINAVSVGGTPYNYDGNEPWNPSNPFTFEINRLFGLGSYTNNAWEQNYSVSPGSAPASAICTSLVGHSKI